MDIKLLKPNKNNLNLCLSLGIILLLLGFIDILSNTLYNLNITNYKFSS